jgi:hypothetical protein
MRDAERIERGEQLVGGRCHQRNFPSINGVSIAREPTKLKMNILIGQARSLRRCWQTSKLVFIRNYAAARLDVL